MISKSTLVHAVIHSILTAFLLVSLGLNWAFFEAKIMMDYDQIKRNREMNDTFPDTTPEKQKN
jgi:hypothetical protein